MGVLLSLDTSVYYMLLSSVIDIDILLANFLHLSYALIMDVHM